MKKLYKFIIGLGLLWVYILFGSFGRSNLEHMSNSNQEKKLIVISDDNFTEIAKHLNQNEFQLVNLSNWKKTSKPFDVFIGFPAINIGNIEKQFGLIEKMCSHAKKFGKIIQFVNGNQTKLAQQILITNSEDLGAKYYADSIGICTIILNDPTNANADANTIDFAIGEPWNILTGRVFSSELIGSKSPGYLLGIPNKYTRTNLIIDRVKKNKFNGETTITPDIEPKELSVYSNSSGALAKKLGEIHGVEPNHIEFHNGIISFLQLMIPVFVPDAHEIICWQMSYLTQLAKSNKVIHVESIIDNFIAIPNYEQILSNLSSKTRLILISGPIGKVQFNKFIKSIPKNIIVIIDFCYDGFVDDNSNQNLQIQDCEKYESYVLGINTFSKANGLAGIHLSYSIGHESIQTIITNYFHYPVNLFYEKLAIKALDNNYVKQVKSFYSNEKTRLSKLFEEKNIPYWFELGVTLVIDLTKLPKDKILFNIIKLGLKNYWKISGNYLKIFLSTEQKNTQLVSAIIN